MSFEHTRFTIMTLPQTVDANGLLRLNIVFIPRNFSPLDEVQTVYNPNGKVPAFVNIKPHFTIKISNDPDEFPGKLSGDKELDPVSQLVYSTVMADIYTTLRDAKDGNGKPKYFDIDPGRSSDQPVSPANKKHRAPEAGKNRDLAIRKYLPHSYRNAFNFTSPRIKNAVTDDSYHCAMRDQTRRIDMTIDNRVSWGKVYAHLLRQPLMAKQAGLIYEVSVQLDPEDFEKGGWIYADLKDEPDSPYFDAQKDSLGKPTGEFVKRYAARIPMLTKNNERSLFASILFPVMKPGVTPTGVFDELYIEAARFNDGFATIVHADQPKSGNLLKEEADGFHPQKDLGIRLGWEDEQILIWYLRQMTVAENSTERLDAPLGVMGYKVDVRVAGGNDADWESLNAVSSNVNLNNGIMQLEGIDIGSFSDELPYQVYPTKVYDDQEKNASSNYWLPMYFANWNNASLVLPDNTAALIYKNAEEKFKPVTVSDSYTPNDVNVKLLYGKDYEFRVRLSDISGGGPSPSSSSPEGLPPSFIGKTPFRRYVAPHTVTIVNESDVKENVDGHNFDASSLKLSRPLLGYPDVVYTGKYNDPVGRLTQAVQDHIDLQESTENDPIRKGAKAFGIPDPDVSAVEIKVEVETLNMDNLASDDGREHYITLYTTTRNFSAFDEMNADEDIEVPIRFEDFPVLKLTTDKPFPLNSDNTFINETSGEILLPRARNIRITLRAVGEDKINYWGDHHIKSNTNPRLGKTTVISMRKESINEQGLFPYTDNPKTLQAIYLQPDPFPIKLDPMAKKISRW
ncbi:MAG: hypothetical protein IPG02_11870 [Ignavibacteria bacterium]|nr:hypothetical protein [Ignavibacteria bacterium]